MEQTFHLLSDLTTAQVDTFKLSVSAACRRMSEEQILDVADLLHEIIRKRGACRGALKLAGREPLATAVGSAEAPPQ